MAISLQSIFNGFKDENNQASVLLISRAVKDFPELSKYSENLEDLSLIHSKLHFDDILEICCSGATKEQIHIIKEWVSSWVPNKGNKKINKKSTTKTSSSREKIKRFTQLFADKHSYK